MFICAMIVVFFAVLIEIILFSLVELRVRSSISKDSAERFVLFFLVAFDLLWTASMVRTSPALLFRTFAELLTNHIKLRDNGLSFDFIALVHHWRSFCHTVQILGTAAFPKMLTIGFDGRDALVDLEEELRTLEVNIELRGLPGKGD